MISLDLLKTLLNYDAETGVFTWKVSPARSKIKAGDVAGCLTQNGRVQITLQKVRYYAHQLALYYSTGEFPSKQIKHLDNHFTNNRLSNLVCIEDSSEPLSRDLVCRLFNYDEITGILCRKVCIGGDTKVGDVAGHVHKRSGYVRVILAGKSYAAHRLIWLYKTGELLPETTNIDHINGIRSDNSWSNLRIATKSENNWNSKLRADNKSGIKGLRYGKNCIECRVAANGVTKYKAFNNNELVEAIDWLETTREALHSEFTNNG
jgi:hypothetical protein